MYESGVEGAFPLSKWIIPKKITDFRIVPVHWLISVFLPICNGISCDSDDFGYFFLEKTEVKSFCLDMITKCIQFLGIHWWW